MTSQGDRTWSWSSTSTMPDNLSAAARGAARTLGGDTATERGGAGPHQPGGSAGCRIHRQGTHAHVPVLPGPHQKLVEAYVVWDAKRGSAIATVIIDKSGVVRFIHQAVCGVEDRPKADQILRALQKLKD